MTSSSHDRARFNRRGIAALILGAIAIGFAPVLVRFSECGPVATGFWRMLLPLPIMLAMAGRSGAGAVSSPLPGHEDVDEQRKSAGRFLVLAGACFAMDLAVWHWAIGLTSVSNATLEANLGVIFVPLLGWLLFRQQVSGRFLAAICVALLGTVLLVGRNASFSTQSLKGDALGILSGLFYSGYILSIKAARDRGVNTPVVMVASGAVSAAILLPIALLMGEKVLPVTVHGWAVVLGLAFLAQLAGQSLITFALASLPASLTAAGLLLQPLTAAIAAWFLLGEALTGLQMAGGVIVMLGIWAAKRSAEA